jgi:hypothetical protein
MRFASRSRWIALCAVLGAALLAASVARAGAVQQKSLFLGALGPVGIAVDGAGRLHVSWESRDHHLHYTRIERGKKLDQVVDATSACGAWSSIALDSAGQPHIAYHAARTSSGPGQLAYAHFDGAQWHVESLADGGYGTAIAIDAQDRPHIVHSSRATQLFEHRFLDDTGWHGEMPAGFRVSAVRSLSLALDSAGHAHVGMLSDVDHPVYATNATGDWVATELFDGSSAAASLALDSLEHPHVGLALADTGTVVHSHFDGSQWLSEDLYDPNDSPAGTQILPFSAALALDAHDRPQMLFKIRVIQGLRSADFVFDAYHDGNEWIGIPLSKRGAADWARLAIDGNGVAHAVYGTAKGTASQVARYARVGLPDVTGDWTSLVSSAAGGSSRVAAVLELRNVGLLKSKSAAIALYLSGDALLDATDQLVAFRSGTGGVAPGATRSVKISFIHTGSVSGLYLIAVIDPAGRTDDLDRLNDVVAGQLQ